MTEAWYYSPGDHYVLDDLTGFKRRMSKCDVIPGGQTGNLVVERGKHFEVQHPQDFVRGIPDEMWVTPTRPRQPDQFMVVSTTVTTYTARLNAVITVDSTLGFNLGDQLMVMLDSGENYYPILVAMRGNLMQLSPVLPYSVGASLGDPIENLIVDLGPAGVTFLIDDNGNIPITDDAGNLIGIP